MTSKLQHRRYRNLISRTRLRAATTTLALAYCLLALGASAQAQTFTTLHSFDGTDGVYPYAALIQATNGDFYGTTSGGGAVSAACAAENGGGGCGTVFKITADGTLTTLYNFCSLSNCTDGWYPAAGLVQATDGDLYGTAEGGGANGVAVGGYGTVFKITPTGTLTTLYSFCSQGGSACTDGEYPNAVLVQATDGNFYGTADYGGAGSNGGTVFKITPGGTLTTLYSLCSQSGCTDGSGPNGLVQASDGDFYGTTSGGGADGDGTVFRITPGGTLTTLHSFAGYPTDGALPLAGLVQAVDGDLYGTTFHGGADSGGAGTVFKITPSGTLTTVYNFCSESCGDGFYPAAAVVQATDGNFYGTTYNGGTGYGTAFKVSPSGALTVLHTFDGADGQAAYFGLVQNTNGSLYGTTLAGGANSDGTVYSLSVGLRPFVEPQTTSGKVGSLVKILGTNLTGATSVTFNGTPAVFKVASPSLITATVPEGATSGKVRVTIDNLTLSSNVPFRVRP